MMENEALLRLVIRGQEIAKLQRRVHVARERYKKVRAELRRLMLSEVTTTKLLTLMAARVAADKERMDKIAAHSRKVTEENQTLKNKVQELEIFIDAAKGKYL